MWTRLLSVSAFSLLAFAVHAAEPQKVWEATGFKSPESAVYDRTAGAIYVSNLASNPMLKDGNGFISKLGPDGKIAELMWVKGLDSPKGEITQRYPAAGAKFLNDLAADKTGRVYASDMVTNSIWVLQDGKFALLVQDDALENPNGLQAEGGRLVIGSWGKMAQDFSTKVPGHMKVLDLTTKKISDLGDPTPVGNLDGVEPDGKGGYFATDWISGGLFRISAEGKATRLLPLKPGSADLGTGPDGILMIPMMMDGSVLAYKLD